MKKQTTHSCQIKKNDAVGPTNTILRTSRRRTVEVEGREGGDDLLPAVGHERPHRHSGDDRQLPRGPQRCRGPGAGNPLR